LERAGKYWSFFVPNENFLAGFLRNPLKLPSAFGIIGPKFDWSAFGTSFEVCRNGVREFKWGL
jgi:hypothetical protein